MAAYTVSAKGSNGQDAVDRVIECVRQNSMAFTITPTIAAGAHRDNASMTFSVAGATGTAPIDQLTAQLRNLFGVNSVSVV